VKNFFFNFSPSATHFEQRPMIFFALGANKFPFKKTSCKIKSIDFILQARLILKLLFYLRKISLDRLLWEVY
jgi:hypothetical protein